MTAVTMKDTSCGSCLPEIFTDNYYFTQYTRPTQSAASRKYGFPSFLMHLLHLWWIYYDYYEFERVKLDQK